MTKMYGKRIIHSALIGWMLAAIFWFIFTIGETYLGMPPNTGIVLGTGAFASSVGVGLYKDSKEAE